MQGGEAGPVGPKEVTSPPKGRGAPKLEAHQAHEESERGEQGCGRGALAVCTAGQPGAAGAQGTSWAVGCTHCVTFAAKRRAHAW